MGTAANVKSEYEIIVNEIHMKHTSLVIPCLYSKKSVTAKNSYTMS